MPIDAQQRRNNDAPRWLKLVGLLMLVGVLTIIIIFVTSVAGPHGPWRHLRAGDATPMHEALAYAPCR